jgi:hypothetical protein
VISTSTRGLCAVQPVMTASREEVVLATWPVGASRRGDHFFFLQFSSFCFFYKYVFLSFILKNRPLHRRQYY